MTSTGISSTITSLNDIEARFGLTQASDPAFFFEWQEELPELTAEDCAFLDRLKQRFHYYQADGLITEGTINLVLVAPLLEYLGLCDPPYKIQGEKLVRIDVQDGGRRLQGLIDVLVVQDLLWLVLIESKRYGFSVTQALPQTLAYMMAAGASPSFGLITSGEDYLFVKLDRERLQYDLSDKLTLTTRRGNQLYPVLQVLRRLVKLV
ncbi:MAG: type I restriction endonuclease subunit R [Cyanobacteria bacterium P01_A01_bin.135]